MLPYSNRSISLEYADLSALYIAGDKMYPGTKIAMEPGDILYSAKGMSTFMVGHVGMVGHDQLVYHSHPKGGFYEELAVYLSRHKFGTELTIYRPVRGAEDAAQWVGDHITRIKRYIFDPRLNTLATNYCSKFIWQAFWYSGYGDVTGRKRQDKQLAWIYPMTIKQAGNLEQLAVVRLERARQKG
ncbi:hypothetical protein [Sediminibacillus halophilus]|uniref:Permuted papain-like amidase enzyme, YaeF/YiiX, C92 family n=1 Tax=Sediminibacillus halophilus TaxID=482461 RepID=A0A1G9TLX6_9BACI|nr:hypothetical protein [Sediminibacillus halophilus]SDM48701.1 hypothetical protein SAMN05216244_2643 [Sediminibacillus halophilus]